MMSRSAINFDKDTTRKDTFTGRLQSLVDEQISNGFITEEYFDELGVPQDTDLSGKIWLLANYESDILGRAKVLSTPARMAHLQEEMIAHMIKQRDLNARNLKRARDTMALNTESEQMLVSMSDIDNLSDIDYVHLNRLSVKQLKAFIVCRQSKDPLVTLRGATKKGTVAEAESGLSTLLTLAKSLRETGAIAEEPRFDPPAQPKALAIPATITSHNNALMVEDWKPTEVWCREAAAIVHPIVQNGKLEYWIQNLDLLDETATLLAKKVHTRLPQFLRNRLKASLQTHWVWDCFVEDFVKRISCLAVLARQQSRCLATTSMVDSLLESNLDVFPKINEELGLLDGCYLASDSCRGDLIRSGMATQTLAKRWLEHLQASLRNAEATMYRNFYWFYPHEREAEKVPGRRGVFQQIDKRLGLGIKKAERERVMNLFNWTEPVNNNLSKLSLGPHSAGTLIDKQYKHICYMFEFFFAVAIKDSDNITQNPGCEWQLQLYSKNQ